MTCTILQALWHEKEGNEELRVLVHRLQADLSALKSMALDTHGAAQRLSQLQERMEASSTVTRDNLGALGEKLMRLEVESRKVRAGFLCRAS
jgi:hypothetical protein